MNNSTIGVQTITPTTGTPAQDSNPAPDRNDSSSRADAPESTTRVNASPPAGTGMIVDKLV